MEVYFISLPVYGRLALLGRDQALFEGFYLEIGKWRGNFKGEVLETGARLQAFSYLLFGTLSVFKIFRIFLPCHTIVLRFPLLDIGLLNRYHYDFYRREHFTVLCRVVRTLNRSEES